MNVSAAKPRISTPEEISYFLYGFRALREKHGIVYLERQKNFQAMLSLEMSPEERETVLGELDVTNYYKGPRMDGVRKGAIIWEFGAKWKGKELYIKLSKGLPDGPVICYSFHEAERPIKYPWKGN